jgi:hypothetical protein
MIGERIALKYSKRRLTTKIDKSDNVVHSAMVTLYGTGEVKDKDTVDLEIKITGVKRTVDILLRELKIEMKESCIVAFFPNQQTRLTEHFDEKQLETDSEEEE